MSLSPGDRLGSYEIRDHIGSGGMGEVYRAHDPKLRRDVALKVLPPAFAHDADRMARFEREARLLASLNHPNIAAIHGFEDSGASRALVMELVEGATLADRIAQSAIPQDDALDLARQIVDALEYAHDHSVIHRDLKPANVKITPEGSIKVLDFGLAKALEEEPAPSSPGASPTLTMDATRAGVILGTAAYMSPEQAKGKTATRRADIWSFGVLLFEMLTGKRLFAGETVVETMAAVMKEPPDLTRLPAATPPAIRHLIARCLEKDPKQRLQAIGEARITLTGPLAADTPAPSAPPATRRSLLWPAVAALLTIGFAALGFVHFRETPPARQTLRYQIPLPDDNGGGFPTLSPDGRHLAFVAPSGGQPQIWIHSLDQLAARPLSGTNGGTYPFWSPDSAYLGFFADGQLKKIAVAGGPATKLTDAVEGRGGTWYGDGSQEGVILYSAGPLSPIFRISSGGGAPEPVIKPANSADGYRFPWFLPDGVHFLYNLVAETSESWGVYLGSLQGDAPVRLLGDYSNAIYAPPSEPGGTGYILFRREETTLMAQPFDPESLKFTAEAYPIAEQVAQVGNRGLGAFSVAGGEILLYRTGEAASRRQLVWMDRTGKRLNEVGLPGDIRVHTLSPDGAKIALLRGAAAQNDLWLQDLAADSPSRLTFLSGTISGMQWSPDGTTLIFAFATSGGFSRDLFRIPAGGGKEELVLRGGVNTRVLDWSRDGRFLVYAESGEATGFDLAILPLEGDGKPVPYLQTRAIENDARISPGGRWMAYVSNESGQQQVYVQDIPATGRKYQISTQAAGTPAWRRDGRELYFRTGDQWMAVPVTLGETFQRGTPQALFNVAGFGPIEPSADGQRFLVGVPAEGAATANPPFTVVTNWQAAPAK